ncbi:Stp1/IreP family PP2C-type Ser/Thr phosphatase [bacterium]|nr:MAG: Stp1/IreP family PP2C-type Ser/Thr phosphatase [bacterium]
MKWSKASHIGLVRKTNEDNSLVCEDLQLLAVADGMGGHQAGEVASRVALDTVSAYVTQNSGDIAANPGAVLQKALAEANQKIYRQARQESGYHGMGTTITAAILLPGKAYLAHVGDSRAYLIHGGEIRLVTDDHSLVNELVKNGGITVDEASRHPQRNVLTRAVGSSAGVDVDLYEEATVRGDILLLCTDGLSNLLSPGEIRDIVTGVASLEEGTARLVELALAGGGADNITVILCMIE